MRIPPTIAFGILSILAGLLIPPRVLIELLRPLPADGSAALLNGAMFFKAGLIAAGIWAIAARRQLRSRTPIPSAASPEERPVHRWLLGGVLVSSLAMRLYDLNSGLWFDEILTHVLYARMPFGEIVTTYSSENQHFLFTLLAHASYELFGEHAWALRLPAVLFGVGSIYALYLLGSWLSGPREALLASALFAFSYHHVWFSQNARGYTGLLFFTLISSWLLLKGLANRSDHRLWLWYALSASLGVYTHLTMVFVVAGQFLVYVHHLWQERERRNSDKWLPLHLGFLPAGLLTYLFYSIVIPQVLGGIRRTESVVEAWKKPFWAFLEILRGLEVTFASSVVGAGAILLFGAGLWSYARTRPQFAGLLLLPPALGSSVVIAMGHHIWPRFFFFAFGFGVLIVIRGAMVAAELAAGRLKLPSLGASRLGTAICSLLILAGAASASLAYGPKQDYSGARAFVESRKEPGDSIVTVGLASFPYRRMYGVNWEAAETIEALDSLRSRSKRTWLLYTLPPVLESMFPEIMASVERDFEVIEEFPGTLQGGTVYVCRSDNPFPRP